MNDRLVKLAKRRQRLVAKAQVQRVALAEAFNAWRKPISMLDYGLNIWHYLKQHPMLVASGSTALFSMLKPNALTKWLQRGLLAWQLLGKLSKKFKS